MNCQQDSLFEESCCSYFCTFLKQAKNVKMRKINNGGAGNGKG
ncbi:hypothetical protein KIS4809_1989 [Bacillus sp. ZZV12-4809]|nr:hypothetical protein KIS4809_1989 [Bacillus sp. ZZV12-4809]